MVTRGFTTVIQWDELSTEARDVVFGTSIGVTVSCDCALANASKEIANIAKGFTEFLSKLCGVRTADCEQLVSQLFSSSVDQLGEECIDRFAMLIDRDGASVWSGESRGRIDAQADEQ